MLETRLLIMVQVVLKAQNKKRIDDLETLVQRLQQRLRIYEDLTIIKTFMDGVDEYNTKEEQDDMDEETVRPSQLRSFLERKNRKTSLHETMIIKKGMMNATMMKITMRGIIMKAQGSTQNLIFQNLWEECMSMTSWIGLIQLKASLSIVTTAHPPAQKGEVGGHQDA